MAAVRAAEVFVIGEALVDIVTDVHAAVAEHVGGSPANVALGLGRLGVPVRLRTALAHDRRGELIRAHLAASSVLVDDASFRLSRTPTARATMSAGGDARYAFDLDWRLDEAPRLAGERIVHTGSIASVLDPGATELSAFLGAMPEDVVVTFDPNVRRQFARPEDTARARIRSVLGMASVVKMSDEDAAFLRPDAPAESVLDEALDAGVRLAVLTRGRHGAVLASPAARVRLDAPAVAVRDTVGAGDSFMAAVIAAVHRRGLAELGERALADIGGYATRAAAITVSRAGADLPYAAELAPAR